jgi:hypothetical protein
MKKLWKNNRAGIFISIEILNEKVVRFKKPNTADSTEKLALTSQMTSF